MNPLDEITALIEQIENAGPLIKAVEELAVDQHDLRAWDCLIVLARAAQNMIDQHIYYDRDSFQYCHAYSIQQQADKKAHQEESNP